MYSLDNLFGEVSVRFFFVVVVLSGRILVITYYGQNTDISICLFMHTASAVPFGG